MAYENARWLNKQGIIDLIANNTVCNRANVGTQTESHVNVDMMNITFKKTEETGGNFSAFSSKS